MMDKKKTFSIYGIIVTTVYRWTLTEQEIISGGTRLDTLITTLMAHQESRTFIRFCIESGGVTVNGVVVTKPGRVVHVGDEIECILQREAPLAVEARPLELSVIAEHPDFVVLNKQAGVLTHPVPTAPQELSLVHGLLYRYPELASFESTERPGIIHRLDRDTSGVLLIARNRHASAALSALFKARSLEKEYLALVVGHPPREGVINAPIGRHPVHRHKMGINGIAARTALTRYRVIAYFEGYSLLSVVIETGRTHQIRVHLASIGTPVLGDAVYGSVPSSRGAQHRSDVGKDAPLLPTIARQALHAYRLAFSYEGVAHEYYAPVPPDMESLIVAGNALITESNR